MRTALMSAEYASGSLQKALSRYTLKRLLLVGFSVVLGLVALVGAVSVLNGRSVVELTNNALDSEVKLDDQSRTARSSYYQARLAEKNFLLFAHKFGVQEAEARYISLARVRTAETVDAVNAIARHTDDPRILELCEEASKSIARYGDRFHAAIPLRHKLDATSRQLRQLGDKLDSTLNAAHAGRVLTEPVKTLRTTTRALLQRAEDRSGKAAVEQASAIRAAVGESDMAAASKAAVTSILDQFGIAIGEFLAVEKQLDEVTVEYLSAADAIAPLLEALNDEAASRARATVASVRQSARTTPIIIAATALLAIFLAAVVAAVLLLFLRNGFEQLLLFANAIKAGNHGARLDESARNEFGLLATHLNDMSDTIASSARALAEKAQALEEANVLLQHRATHDVLTGLPNRSLLNDRFEQAAARAKRSDGKLAVAFIDLDKFKWVNDSYGHHVGDEVLREMAARLKRAVRAEDTAARLGGDEFALLIEARDSEAVAGILERVSKTAMAPIAVGTLTTGVTVSLGVAMFPQDGETLDDLQRNADAALYKAKSSGRNNFQFYSKNLTQGVSNRLELTQRLDRALLGDELLLHYQPKVDLASGRVCGLEALVRWQTPEGLVPPSDFIPLAEETGRICALGEWVLRKACAEIRKLQELGFELPISVNVSASQFKQDTFVSRVREIVEEAQIPPRLLELEITESVLVQDVSRATNIMQELNAMGISISLDDFGTGYSNLSYLSRFPIQTLKIDRSLVHDLAERDTGASIIRALLALARELGMKVVAEGVEDEKQLQLLWRLKCDQMQGYLFSRPLPEERMVELLKQRRRLPENTLERFTARQV